MNEQLKQWAESLNKDIISVVVPTYNRSNFLGPLLKALESCVYSSILDVVIVDDGSDEYHGGVNAQLFREYETENVFHTLRYIKLDDNSGTVSIPRNIGISHILGRAIAPTDDDCLPRNKKFAQLYGPLWENNKTLLAFGDREEYQADINGDFNYYRTVNCSKFELSKESVGLDNGQFIYKADVYQWAPPQFPINACDWELYSRFAPYGDFTYVGQPVSKYLWHGRNISHTPKHARPNPLSKLEKYLPYFKEGAFKDACKSLLNS